MFEFEIEANCPHEAAELLRNGKGYDRQTAFETFNQESKEIEVIVGHEVIHEEPYEKKVED